MSAAGIGHAATARKVKRRHIVDDCKPPQSQLLQLGNLPEHLHYHILTQLAADGSALGAAAAVCRLWREHASSRELWRIACIARWPSSTQSLAVICTADGPRGFYRRRHAAALAARSQWAASQSQQSAQMELDKQTIADLVWMIDVLCPNGRVLWSTTAETKATDCDTTFPFLIETVLLDADGNPRPFNTILPMAPGLSVSIMCARRSDSKMLSVTDRTPLAVETDAGSTPLDLLAANFPIVPGVVDGSLSAFDEELHPTHRESPLTARLEIDGTDIGDEGTTASLMVLWNEDDPTIAEFARAMRLATWV